VRKYGWNDDTVSMYFVASSALFRISFFFLLFFFSVNRKDYENFKPSHKDMQRSSNKNEKRKTLGVYLRLNMCVFFLTSALSSKKKKKKN
jgi:hypothetical protein